MKMGSVWIAASQARVSRWLNILSTRKHQVEGWGSSSVHKVFGCVCVRIEILISSTHILSQVGIVYHFDIHLVWKQAATVVSVGIF